MVRHMIIEIILVILIELKFAMIVLIHIMFNLIDFGLFCVGFLE